MSIPHDDTMQGLLRAIDDLARAQRQQRALIGLLTEVANPFGWRPPATSTPDCCDCEICGEQVAAPDMAPFAKRHGAIIHVNCLTTQMNQR